jgi:hypothetical protein
MIQLWRQQYLAPGEIFLLPSIPSSAAAAFSSLLEISAGAETQVLLASSPAIRAKPSSIWAGVKCT